jgi:hypothetical protein
MRPMMLYCYSYEDVHYNTSTWAGPYLFWEPHLFTNHQVRSEFGSLPVVELVVLFIPVMNTNVFIIIDIQIGMDDFLKFFP